MSIPSFEKLFADQRKMERKVALTAQQQQQQPQQQELDTGDGDAEGKGEAPATKKFPKGVVLGEDGKP